MNKGLSKCELPFPSEVCDFLVRDSQQVLCALEIYVVSSLFPFHTVHTGQRKQIKIIQMLSLRGISQELLSLRATRKSHLGFPRVFLGQVQKQTALQ